MTLQLVEYQIFETLSISTSTIDHSHYMVDCYEHGVITKPTEGHVVSYR